MLGLGADFGLTAAPRAVAALIGAGVWDAERGELELQAYRELARRSRARALKE
jgi:hypothetical protein